MIPILIAFGGVTLIVWYFPKLCCPYKMISVTGTSPDSIVAGKCVPGTEWNPSLKKCVPECATNEVWNPIAKQCIPVRGNTSTPQVGGPTADQVNKHIQSVTGIGSGRTKNTTPATTTKNPRGQTLTQKVNGSKSAAPGTQNCNWWAHGGGLNPHNPCKPPLPSIKIPTISGTGIGSSPELVPKTPIIAPIGWYYDDDDDDYYGYNYGYDYGDCRL